MTHSSWQLDGKTALVTGGTRGIGRAIVDELASHGAFVIAAARHRVSYDDETIERLIALNLTAPLLLSRDLHPFLHAASGASVIHIGSIARGAPGCSPARAVRSSRERR